MTEQGSKFWEIVKPMVEAVKARDAEVYDFMRPTPIDFGTDALQEIMAKEPPRPIVAIEVGFDLFDTLLMASKEAYLNSDITENGPALRLPVFGTPIKPSDSVPLDEWRAVEGQK